MASEKANSDQKAASEAIANNFQGLYPYDNTTKPLPQSQIREQNGVIFQPPTIAEIKPPGSRTLI